MKKKIYSIIVAATCALTLSAQTPYEEIMADINKAGGVYYVCDFGEIEDTPAPKGYKPFYVTNYARHGARYDLRNHHYDLLNDVLSKAHADGQLTDFGEQIHDRYMNVYPLLRMRAGELTTKGQAQQIELGQRMYDAYPEIFKKDPKVVIYSTDVPRCIMSMASFVEGLRSRDPKMDIFTEASKSRMYYLNPHSVENPNIGEYDLKAIKGVNSPLKDRQKQIFAELVDNDAFLARLFKDVSYPATICDPVVFEQRFFSMATNMQCTDIDVSFYDVFTKEEMYNLWQCDNIFYYQEKGDDMLANGRTYAVAESLLEDIIVKTDEDIARGYPNAHLRFGHDGCLMALYCLMDLEGWKEPLEDFNKVKDYWQNYNVPMATNFRLVLYRSKKSDEILFKAYHNDKEMELPLPSDLAPYYRWNDFREKYTKIVREAQQLLEETKDDFYMSEEANIWGKVTAQGKPLEGVLISDGYQFVKTDAKGRYCINSEKKDSIVFVVTPSGYEAVEKDGVQNAFWHRLDGDPKKNEWRDFELVPVDQTNYTMMVMTDSHFLKDPERNDLNRFETVQLPVYKDIAAKASEKGPVYAVNLGDFSHERYWKLMNFNGVDAYNYLASVDFPAKFYGVCGNHDNDPAIIGEDVDSRSAHLYRQCWGPEWYSANIGGDHWIFIDNAFYINTPGKGKKAPGVLGARDYRGEFTPEQLAWLEKDLSHVSKDTDIYLCTHIPLMTNEKEHSHAMPVSAIPQLDELFSKFEKVTVFSGHLHRMIFVDREDFPRFSQYCFPALSGNVWECAQDKPLLGEDGTEAGVPYIEFAEGEPYKVRYQTQRLGEAYMSIHDMNKVSEYYRTDPDVRAFVKLYPERADFSNPKYRNMIHVNYWAYCPGQIVEVYENGRALKVQKISDEDPLYNECHYIPAAKKSGFKFKKSFSKPEPNPHMFAAKAQRADSDILVVIKDESGNEIRRSELKR